MEENLNQIKAYFDEKYLEFGMLAPMDPLPKQVFAIISGLIDCENEGQYFINVNARELGREHDTNYAQLIDAIVQASVRRRFRLNVNNTVPELEEQVVTYRRYMNSKKYFLN